LLIEDRLGKQRCLIAGAGPLAGRVAGAPLGKRPPAHRARRTGRSRFLPQLGDSGQIVGIGLQLAAVAVGKIVHCSPFWFAETIWEK
jgi:hypothetical protein